MNGEEYIELIGDNHERILKEIQQQEEKYLAEAKLRKYKFLMSLFKQKIVILKVASVNCLFQVLPMGISKPGKILASKLIKKHLNSKAFWFNKYLRS